MNVVVRTRFDRLYTHNNAVKIEKKAFHLFITNVDGEVYTYELDDVKNIEVGLWS